MNVILRDVTETDLHVLFKQQLDPAATAMAAFPSRDRDTFAKHWARLMADPSMMLKTILCDGEISGHIVCFEMDDIREVGYWLGREFWGKGIATEALKQFLELIKVRPLYGHVAKHNIGSRRVLEKCGFELIGEDTYLNPAGEAVEEYILKLEGN